MLGGKLSFSGVGGESPGPLGGGLQPLPSCTWLSQLQEGAVNIPCDPPAAYSPYSISFSTLEKSVGFSPQNNFGVKSSLPSQVSIPSPKAAGCPMECSYSLSSQVLCAGSKTLKEALEEVGSSSLASQPVHHDFTLHQ